MIVYPGIEEHFRKQWGSLFDDEIEKIEPDKRAKVSEVCASCGLDEDATKDVLLTVLDLIEFERHDRDRLLTDAERFELIEYIRDTSHSLAMAMKDLQQIWDHVELRESFRKVTEALEDSVRLRLDGSRPPDALTLAVLAQAAHLMVTSKGELQGKGGRRGLRMHYSGKCIAPLADTFERCGLPVGRGGAFERLCSVVFEVAGVRATPEGAIRYYLEERKKRSQNGPENSSEEAAE